MIKIRDYKHDDFKRLCEVHDAARFNELKASHLEEAFVPLEVAAKTEGLFEYIVKVATILDVVVGFVGYTEDELGWLYVDPAYKKQGIGKCLVDHVKDECFGDLIALEVIADNKPALAFYKKMGFNIISEARGKMPGNEAYEITVYEMHYRDEIERLRAFKNSDLEEILKTWESSVKATHHFLEASDIEALKPQVVEGVQFVEDFFVIRDNDEKIIAFLGCHKKKIEMLFVAHEARRQGIGKRLLRVALQYCDCDAVDVNEDNIQGLGFYLHMGFEKVSQSAMDDAGNPFPILHLKIK